MIEQAIYAILTGDATVSATLGTRIYPNAARENSTRPYATFARIGTEHVESFEGSSGFASALIQIDLWGDSYLALKTLAENIRLAMQGYKGIAGGVDVQAILSGTEEDDWISQTSVTGGEEVLHRLTMDFTAWFAEAQPA